MTSLEQLPVGVKARVEQLQGGYGFLQKVRDLGIGEGQVVRKIQQTGRGPVLIECGELRVAIGHGIAQRIFVQELSEGQ